MICKRRYSRAHAHHLVRECQGIGTIDPANLLSVAGTIQAYEVLVNTGWSDYVFAPTIGFSLSRR